jgi:hypothetical protein
VVVITLLRRSVSCCSHAAAGALLVFHAPQYWFLELIL